VPAGATTIAPSDPNILYTGRWDQSNASQPWAQAQGSSIIVVFDGTSIGVTMTTGSEYFRVIIDGDAASSSKVLIPSGSLTSLASGLADTLHQLELVKETDQGRSTLLNIELDAGKSLAPPPPRPTRRIVFYGDSNLAGYSLDSERNQSGWNLVGAYYGLAGITARMFGAEYHNLSKSGATIQSLNTSYDRIDWNANNPSWDFSLFSADVVVVNIGANDYWQAKNLNKTRYHNLLDDLRADHPAAHVMLFNGFGWEGTEPANYIDEVIAERADPNMSWEIFPWVFEQYHGSQTDHAGMAQVLAAHLSTVMGWVPGSTDVMSGYGLNGDVANGGFEERAPFGGWGWRYFNDAGVSRVHDVGGAFRGEYYLRLSNGASSHQTNPAGNGERVPLSVWMRATTAGDEADITISFRDQDGGGEFNAPLQTLTVTKVLTTSWKLYTMTVTAPVNPPTPVYSVRVELCAGSGDTVHIDAVEVGEIIPSFCDDADGALASCPCANPGNPDTGCDISQGTGGVGLSLAIQQNTPQNRVTWSGTGFPAASTPTSIVIRATSLDPGAPVVFGDGLRCIGTPLVRLAATFASGGTATHSHGHGTGAGSGTFHYQLWFRNTPVMFCNPTAAFNLSSGRTLTW